MSIGKRVLAPYHIIKAQSMVGNILSPVTSIQYGDNVGIQLNWTGTPNGSFFVQVSLDNVNFIPITLPTPVTAAGTASSAYISLNQLDAAYIQFGYTAASSTGTLDAYITWKAF